MEKLKACYAAYLAAVEKAEKNKSTWNGAFGLGTSTKDHPCHDDFYEAMETWCEEFLRKNPTQAEAEEAVRYIFEMSEAHRGKLPYWYMYAAHGFTRPIIPLVSAAFAARMRVWYNERNPRPDRMPVQREVFKLLKKQEKAK